MAMIVRIPWIIPLGVWLLYSTLEKLVSISPPPESEPALGFAWAHRMQWMQTCMSHGVSSAPTFCWMMWHIWYNTHCTQADSQSPCSHVIESILDQTTSHRTYPLTSDAGSRGKISQTSMAQSSRAPSWSTWAIMKAFFLKLLNFWNDLSYSSS